MVCGLSKDKMQFYYLSTNPEPHYTKWYDPECGHVENGKKENTCAFCLKSYNAADNDIEWIKCPICENWFHEQCFFAEYENFLCWMEDQEIYYRFSFL